MPASMSRLSLHSSRVQLIDPPGVSLNPHQLADPYARARSAGRFLDARLRMPCRRRGPPTTRTLSSVLGTSRLIARSKSSLPVLE
jgi:hypothetical protein